MGAKCGGQLHGTFLLAYLLGQRISEHHYMKMCSSEAAVSLLSGKWEMYHFIYIFLMIILSIYRET